MMEKYYDQASQIHYSGTKLEDAFPQYHFQVGATPEFKEKAKSHCNKFANYKNDDKPVSECPPVYDSKWRFFWSVGERNKEADEGMLIYPNVHPKGINYLLFLNKAINLYLIIFNRIPAMGGCYGHMGL